MKTKIFFVLFWILCASVQAQSVTEEETQSKNSTEIVYNAEKAQKYGADDYGMKKYVFAFLKRGPNRSLPKEEADALQAAHLRNIGKMAQEGKLVLAGPFFGNDDLRGIYIFNVPSLEEAKQLTETDPAIKAGSLMMELKEWYGTAALMEVNEIGFTLAKKPIVD
ncbi:YciI family protein [Flagellimonas meishanensis]|uniref:YciI family protein n=1 Tax=Flagellimonas meishanensis TaxID=2873264 RepID=UPI001CA74AFF|nr:YciI family protein [[Muricauda] meishanensis]